MQLLLLALLGLVADTPATGGLVADTPAKQFLVETNNPSLLHDDEPNEDISGQHAKDKGSDYSLSFGSLTYPNKMSAKSEGKMNCVLLVRTEIVVWPHFKL